MPTTLPMRVDVHAEDRVRALALAIAAGLIVAALLIVACQDDPAFDREAPGCSLAHVPVPCELLGP